jgi:FKBP12-rapamycin complex-associated protein
VNFGEFSSILIHPLLKLIKVNGKFNNSIINAIISIIYQLKTDFLIYEPLITKVFNQNKINSNEYNSLIKKLFNNEIIFINKNLEINDNSNSNINENTDYKKIETNLNNLKKFWETKQKSTKEDWEDWIRSFSVGLLKEVYYFLTN